MNNSVSRKVTTGPKILKSHSLMSNCSQVLSGDFFDNGLRRRKSVSFFRYLKTVFAFYERKNTNFALLIKIKLLLEEPIPYMSLKTQSNALQNPLIYLILILVVFSTEVPPRKKPLSTENRRADISITDFSFRWDHTKKC